MELEYRKISSFFKCSKQTLGVIVLAMSILGGSSLGIISNKHSFDKICALTPPARANKQIKSDQSLKSPNSDYLKFNLAFSESLY